MSHEDKTPMRRNNTGFTIIELLLAMTFIATLLLTISMTIVQIASIYNHGMILKEVNQTARSITQELDRAVRASSSFSTNPADHQYVNNPDWGGRLCLGQYSYVWNYGTALGTVNPNRNFYTNPAASNPGSNIVKDSSGTRSEISFVKVLDPTGSYCVPNAISGSYPAVNPANATELLRSGDHSLVVHALSVTSAPTAKDTLSAQALYKFSFTLGTSDSNALTTDSSGKVTATSLCKAPNVTGSDLNYCSIEQFTIVLRAVSGVN